MATSMEEDQRNLWKDVLGSSSESEGDQELEETHPSHPPNPPDLGDDLFLESPNRNPGWLPVPEINGLWLCSDFLSAHHQSSLLSFIEIEGWFPGASHNQAMRFGDLPPWIVKLSKLIHEVARNNGSGDCIMPSQLLSREPFFDQLICNVYQPGEGICAHVDLMRFEDGIAIVSLESPCVMHFSQADSDSKVPVYLTPGSLVIMSGEARYLWRHEINRKPGFQVWQDQEIDQRQRTSITLRKLCRTE